MKKFAAMILLAALLLACLNGCSLLPSFFETDDKIAQAQIDAVLSALQEEDSDALKALFSNHTRSSVDDFDRVVEDLFVYYQGAVVSVHDWGMQTSKEREGDMTKKDLYLSYDVTTEDQIYRLAIHYCATNDYAPEQEGICSLYIIKMVEDTDPQYAYRGDHAYIPGIHIGIRNTLPEVVDGTVPHV